MSKYSRSGGKFSGNHTTLIPAACIVADIAQRCAHVSNISPGFIKAGLPSVNGKRRVKITSEGASILLSVRDNTSHQEIRVYADNLQEAMTFISKGCLGEGFAISYKTKEKQEN